MSQTNTDVHNDYGFADDEYANERKAARALAGGNEPPASLDASTEEVPQPEPDAAPTPEAKPEESKTEPAAPATAEAPQTTVDPLASLPEDVRSQVSALINAEKEQAKKLQKKYDSDIGRVNAYQSKYEETRRKLAELEAKLAASDKTPPKSLKESAKSPRLREMFDADPALAEVFDEAFAQKERELEERFNQRLASVAEPLYEARRHEAERQFTETLDSRYSNWRETVYATDESGIVRDANGQPTFSAAWAQYIREQPPSIQQAIVNVNSAHEAVWALDNYANWAASKGAAGAAAEQAQQTPGNAVIPNADAIAEKRQKDLKKPNTGRPSQVPLATFQQEDLSDERTERRYRQQIREALAKGDPSLLKWR